MSSLIICPLSEKEKTTQGELIFKSQVGKKEEEGEKERRLGGTSSIKVRKELRGSPVQHLPFIEREIET